MPETTELGQKIITEIRRLAANDPLFVYTPPPAAGVCVYVNRGQGSCIVGQALVNLDLLNVAVEHDLALVVPFNGAEERRHRVNMSRARDLLPFLGVEVTTPELEWINMVQRQQDSRTPWGEAIIHADEDLSA